MPAQQNITAGLTGLENFFLNISLSYLGPNLIESQDFEPISQMHLE